MATGAKEQLREEVGDEIADIDWRKLDPRQYDPRKIIKDALLDDFDDALQAAPRRNPARARAPPRTRPPRAAAEPALAPGREGALRLRGDLGRSHPEGAGPPTRAVGASASGRSSGSRATPRSPVPPAPPARRSPRPRAAAGPAGSVPAARRPRPGSSTAARPGVPRRRSRTAPSGRRRAAPATTCFPRRRRPLAGLLRDRARALGHLGRGGLRRGHHEDRRRGSSWATEIAMSPVPGRQIQQQDVEVPEVHVGEELLQGAVQHGAAPHHRLVAVDEHADGNDLHPVADGRQDHVVHAGGGLGDAHEGRARRSRARRRR